MLFCYFDGVKFFHRFLFLIKTINGSESLVLIGGIQKELHNYLLTVLLSWSFSSLMILSFSLSARLDCSSFFFVSTSAASFFWMIFRASFKSFCISSTIYSAVLWSNSASCFEFPLKSLRVYEKERGFVVFLYA